MIDDETEQNIRAAGRMMMWGFLAGFICGVLATMAALMLIGAYFKEQLR